MAKEAGGGERAEATGLVARGVTAMLMERGLAPVRELALGNGRRADIAALGPSGEIWIVETKSGVADFASDRKWREYRAFCDRFYFGVDEGFPLALLPEDVGVIVADRFGADIVRPAAALPLAPARRKAVTLAFARLAAIRLARSSGA